MKRRSFLIVMVIIMVLVVALSVVGCGEADKLAITITNKQDLTAEWVEGSAARELEVAFVLGEAQAEGLPYSVETSDSGVVAVGDDNKTLTAEGQGTATITVKATLDDGNEISDSVSISVIPYLRGIEISNKEDLQKVWILGDATRTISINFKPEYYNTNKPEYTVVSSDSSIVEVGEDKATLTAKAIGTATITVSAGNRSDTVEIIVRPALESISITNKEALETVWNDWSVVRKAFPDLHLVGFDGLCENILGLKQISTVLIDYSEFAMAIYELIKYRFDNPTSDHRRVVLSTAIHQRTKS